MLALLTLAALAGSFRFYDPDSVAAESALFSKAASELGPRFEEAETALSQFGRALEELEVGAALLGTSGGEFGTWAEGVKRTINGQYVQTQRHVDLVQDDYAKVFDAALQRALVGALKGAVECKAQTSGLGPRFGGPAPKSCEGEDVSGAVAKALDADQALALEVAEINGVDWPAVGVPVRAWEPARAPGSFVQMGPVVKAFYQERLRERQQALDMKLADLEDAIDQNDAAAIARAAEHKKAYLQTIASDGTALVAALEASLARAAKKGSVPAGVGFCANPVKLGGCTGTDVTEAALAWMKADSKLQSALRKP